MPDLISKDAAIAAIEAAKRDFPDAEFMNAEFVINESACIGLSRAALEVTTLPSPWLSVKDGLPEEDKRVLIYDDVCREVCICYLYGGVWHGESYQEEHDASHWMELPSPPKN